MVLAPDFVTPEQAARMLDVSGSAIRRWVGEGRLEGYRVGGRLRIPRDAVRAFVIRVEPPTATPAGAESVASGTP